jgi:hypothetical protein
MKLTIVSAGKRVQSAPQVAIYSNGNLAFNKSAVEKLNLTGDKSYHIALAVDEQHKPEEKLFLIFNNKAMDQTRKVLINEKSCIVNFAKALQAINMDYTKNKYSFSIEKDTTWEGNRVVVLSRLRK